MQRQWREHRIRVRETEAPTDNLVFDELDRVGLLVAFDLHTLCAVRVHCGMLPAATMVSLMDTIPWQAAYGLPPLACLDVVRLRSLSLADGYLPWPPRPLCLAAVLAAFLEMRATQPPYDGRTGFDLVLASHPGRFGGRVSEKPAAQVPLGALPT